MLINCSECGREISDKASVCPHCGNPMVPKIKSKPSLSHIPCPNCGANWHTFDDNDNDICKVCNHIFTEKEIYSFKSHQQTIQSSKPKCPKCGSISITTGQRGYSLWTGFLGSNKTVNRCSNCGYTWQPKK